MSKNKMLLNDKMLQFHITLHFQFFYVMKPASANQVYFGMMIKALRICKEIYGDVITNLLQLVATHNHMTFSPW